MKQTQLDPTLLPTAVVMDVGRADESVLILLRHCRDMKRQEANLRLVTLLLLLCCVGLFILNIYAHSRQREYSGSNGQMSAIVQSPADSQQESVCPTGNPPAEEKLHIRHSSVGDDNQRDERYVTWRIVRKNSSEAIVIPKKGLYFVNIRVTLSCQGFSENFNHFKLELRNFENGYGSPISLFKARDGLVCNTSDGEGDRTVNFVEFLDLNEGDKVKMWIVKGYKLIQLVEFGAYLTRTKDCLV